MPRPSPEAQGSAHPPHADRIESQEGRLPPRSSPRTYIDQHQCTHRPSRNPSQPPRLSPSRSSNPPSRRTLRNHPPPSRNFPGSERNPSPTNKHRPGPPPNNTYRSEMASPNSIPPVTYNGVINWYTYVTCNMYNTTYQQVEN